ncbi:MAG: hypothetical protein IJP89_08100 [Synergistaceae bacterium]|nr:hypothetical protein [Synergistaceae bacterium]
MSSVTCMIYPHYSATLTAHQTSASPITMLNGLKCSAINRRIAPPAAPHKNQLAALNARITPQCANISPSPAPAMP